MQLSVATASLYFRPFEEVLQIIAETGFQNIELDLFWERKGLAVKLTIARTRMEALFRLTHITLQQYHPERSEGSRFQS